MGRVLVLLLCLVPHADRPVFDETKPVAVIYCREIEINTTYDWREKKQKWVPRFHQIIGWKRYREPQLVGTEDNWRVYNAGNHVVAYHLIVKDSQRMRYRFPFVRVQVKLQYACDQVVEYRGYYWKRTHTTNDPEMDDREWWPLELRDNGN